MFDIEKKLIKKAVAERNETNWRSEIANLPRLHARYDNPYVVNQIEGYTEGDYKKLMGKDQ